MTFDEKVGLLMDIFIENNLDTLCAADAGTFRMFREKGGDVLTYRSWEKVVTSSAMKLNLEGVTVPICLPPSLRHPKRVRRFYKK